MSQAEIAAAARALHADTRRAVRFDGFLDTTLAAPPISALMLAWAAQVRAEPMYRKTLVAHLRACLDNGTYAMPAAAIVDQLMGRLIAGALTS